MSIQCLVATGVLAAGISRNEDVGRPQIPLQTQKRQGQMGTDRELEAGFQSHLQGKDRALARRVQNQDLVQGLV